MEKLIHRKVVESAYEIISLKGYTSWAIGLSVASIVHAIMHNSRNIFALSTNVNVSYFKFFIIKLQLLFLFFICKNYSNITLNSKFI